MKLGLVTYNIAPEMDMPTLIDCCERLGYAGVELRATHAHGVGPELDAAARDEVKRRFADSEVELVGLGSICEYHAVEPERVRANVEETKAWIRLAADLGCSGVKVRPNGNQVEAGVPLEKTLEQIGHALGECGQFAEDYPVELRLEVHGPVTSEIPHMRTIIDVADHPKVNVCWNSDDKDVWDGSVAESLALVRDKLSLVHLHDLTSPTYPYDELFKLLAGSGYDGYCLAEIPPSSDPERVLTYYRSLYLALQP